MSSEPRQLSSLNPRTHFDTNLYPHPIIFPQELIGGNIKNFIKVDGNFIPCPFDRTRGDGGNADATSAGDADADAADAATGSAAAAAAATGSGADAGAAAGSADGDGAGAGAGADIFNLSNYKLTNFQRIN